MRCISQARLPRHRGPNPRLALARPVACQMATAAAPADQEPRSMTLVGFLCKTPQAQRAFIAAAQQAAKVLDAAGILLQPIASALPAAQHCATSTSTSAGTSTAATSSTHNNSSSSSSSSGSHEGAAAAALSQFDGQRFMSHLSSSSMGHVLLTAADINSTQQFLQQHSAAFGPGCVMVADRQSSGKGRGGNSWVSPAGCLMFSCLWSLKVPGSQAPFINYVISLALIRAVRDAMRAAAPSLQQQLDVRIKWPNDIYVSGLKIGGILINTTISQGRFNIVCGVGLNLDNRQPTTCINQLLDDALAAQAAQAGSNCSQGSNQDQPDVHGQGRSLGQGHHHSRASAQGEGAAGASSTAAGHEGTEQHGSSSADVGMGSSSADGGSGSSKDAAATVAGGAAPGPHQAGEAASGADFSAAASSTVGSGSSARGLVSRELLLACVMNQLEQCFQVFEASGFSPLQEEYLASWLHSGQRVLAFNPDLAQPTTQAKAGAGDQGTWLTVCGLSPGGFLLAEDDWGNAYELTPDGNSLDMMRGLVKRKVPSS